ncbi:MAG: hypothetical protein H8D34_29090 [Chloroflexi bacterium]|nr:hypothetical protein [Chloroflexota bacterium]
MHFATLFTVCGHAERNCPRIFLSQGKHTHWDFEDPAAFKGLDEAKLAKFREVRDQLEQRIQNRSAKGVLLLRKFFSYVRGIPVVRRLQKLSSTHF